MTHPRIVMHSMRAVANLFQQFNKLKMASLLNKYYVSCNNTCINKVLDVNFLAGGFSTQCQDPINDISQNCDTDGLQAELVSFLDQLVTMIGGNVMQGNAYSEDHVELILNNFGGLLQILIAHVRRENLSEEIQSNLCELLSALCARDSCRHGMLLILNGILNSFKPEWMQNLT